MYTIFITLLKLFNLGINYLQNRRIKEKVLSEIRTKADEKIQEFKKTREYYRSLDNATVIDRLFKRP